MGMDNEFDENVKSFVIGKKQKKQIKNLLKFVKNQKDLPSEINKIVNDNFWNLM